MSEFLYKNLSNILEIGNFLQQLKQVDKDSISGKENTNMSVICLMYPKSLKEVC